MKLSVYTLIFKEYKIEQIAKVLNELGYDGIEIRVHTDGIHLPIEASKEEVTQVKKIVNSYGLEVPAVSSYVKLGYPEDKWKEEKKKALKVAKIAQLLEAPYFRVQTAGYDERLGYEKIRELIRNQIEDLHTSLKNNSIEVIPVIEQHGGGCIASSAGIIIDLIRGIEPEKIGVLYDPGNAVWEGWEPPKVQIDILKEYIRHVHVKNYDRDPKNPRKCIPASLDSGIVDWEEVIFTLHKFGYRGYLSLEDFRPIPPEQKSKEALNYLRSILRKLGY